MNLDLCSFYGDYIRELFAEELLGWQIFSNWGLVTDYYIGWNLVAFSRVSVCLELNDCRRLPYPQHCQPTFKPQFTLIQFIFCRKHPEHVLFQCLPTSWGCGSNTFYITSSKLGELMQHN